MLLAFRCVLRAEGRDNLSGAGLSCVRCVPRVSLRDDDLPQIPLIFGPFLVTSLATMAPMYSGKSAVGFGLVPPQVWNMTPQKFAGVVVGNVLTRRRIP